MNIHNNSNHNSANNDITSSYLGKYVRVTKLQSLNEDSEFNIFTISPNDNPWWCEGFIEMFDPVLYLLRVKNCENPEGKYGYFHTSTIQNVNQKDNGLIVETKNSKYFVEILDDVKIHVNRGSEPEIS